MQEKGNHPVQAHCSANHARLRTLMWCTLHTESECNHTGQSVLALQCLVACPYVGVQEMSRRGDNCGLGFGHCVAG